MKVCLKFAVVILFVLMHTGCSEKKYTNDPSSNKNEILANKNCPVSKNNICTVPFATIYSSIVNDLDSYYAIKGYLVLEDGKYILYPNKDSIAYGIKESAVLINCNCEMNTTVVNFNQEKVVEVVGKFSMENSGEYWTVMDTKKIPIPVPILIRDEYVPAPPNPTERIKDTHQ